MKELSRTIFEEMERRLDSQDDPKAGIFWYNPETNTINITPYAQNKYSTLVHEVQHSIQKIEGFASGGNTEIVVEKLPDDSIRDIADKIITKENKNLEKKNSSS